MGGRWKLQNREGVLQAPLGGVQGEDQPFVVVGFW